MSWGRGNGHITRLLTIATAFRQAGWDCFFLGHGFPLHKRLLSEARFTDSVFYGPDFDTADPWLLWNERNFLSQSVVEDSKILDMVKPTRVINDNRLSMLISCGAASIPIVSICQDNQLPDFTYHSQPVSDIWTRPVENLNRALEHHGLPQIGSDARELFLRGRIAIPSTTTLDPVPSRYADLDVVHTGALNAVRSSAEGQDLLFYRTVGRIDEEFMEAFADWPGIIFVATGDDSLAAGMQRCPAGVRVRTLWDLHELGPGLRGVVHHGGHGITTTCLASGIPAVVVPGRNPERSANGHRAQKFGWARVHASVSSTSAVWGATADRTGDRPPWREIRYSLETLPLPSGEPTTAADPLELVADLT